MHGELLNDREELLDPPVNVGLGRVSIHPEHVWCWVLFLLKVPDVLVGAEYPAELALLVLFLAVFYWVRLRFVLTCVHQFTVALSVEEPGDLALDLRGVETLCFEALQ